MTEVRHPTIEDLTIAGAPARGRLCGNCSACCTQVPVKMPNGIVKKANERCPALRSSGCRIYQHRPDPCRAWSCRWLFDEDTAELARPDKSGVVIDPWPDEVIIDGRVGHVIQLWVDPKRPDAHRDPALRRYLGRLAERLGLPTLVRWSSDAGLTLVPPSMSSLGDWIEVPSEMHSADEMKVRLAAAKNPPPEGEGNG